MPTQTLGELIKQRRADLNIDSQYQLAKTLDVSAAYVSQLESGARRPKQEAFVSKLALALDVSTDTIWIAMSKAPPDLIAALTNADHVRTVRSALNLPTPE